MRVVVIGNGWSPNQSGGLNRYVTNLSSALSCMASVEQRVLVLSPAAINEDSYVNTVASVDDILVKRLAGFYSSARRELRDGADLLVGHFALNLLPVLLLRRALPLVVHFHGPWADESGVGGDRAVKKWIKRQLEKAVYRRATRFVVLSDSFKRVLVRDYSIEEKKIVVVRPGVDIERFSVDSLMPEVRQAICVRRLVPRMGVDVLLRAWAKCSPDGQLVVVGDGSELERLRRLSKELNIGDSVQFTGFVPDVELAELYSRSTVSIVPTLELEGYGLVCLESLASGVPVIASRVGGLEEALGPFSPQWLVEPNDVDALAELLTVALERPEELPPRDSCREWARAHSWMSTARECLIEYQEAVSARRSMKATE